MPKKIRSKTAKQTKKNLLNKIYFIKKRDGRIVSFDQEKITDAVRKAFLVAREEDGAVALKVSDDVVKNLNELYGGKTPNIEQIQDVVIETLKKSGAEDVAISYSDYRKKRTEIREAKWYLIDKDTKIKLTPNAVKVLESRYLRKDENGKIVETPSKMFRRVAQNIASAEKVYKPHVSDDEIFEIGAKFYKMMANLEFLPNSPTLMNAGAPLQQLSGCFVLPVEDSMESIFEAVKNTALIHQSGGGTGFSFSRLRPKNDRVKSTSGIASGPISFMTVFDKATEVVKQGGRRRGANMGILRVDHPDILEFITCKDKEGFLQNFNISVALTDDFMRAVEKRESYPLISPRNGEVIRKLDARNVFNLMSEHAWVSGDPGIIFIDRMNDPKTNPTPKLGRIESTNPCAEQPLLPYESCNLGSVNVSRMLRAKGKKYEIDWDKLKETTRWAVRFLDNVVEMNNYPLPQISAMTRGNRRIGLGIMGFADALIKMEISYKSPVALKFAEKLMKFIDDEADKMSQELSEIRGTFPNYKDSLYDLSGGPKMRNVTVTTIAPTGTIGVIAGCSQGIEPIFALAYVRLSYIGNDPDKPIELLETNPLLEEVAKREKFLSEDLMKNIALSGSLQKVDGVPAKWKKIFITAHDLAPVEHVKIQAAFQKYTDCAVSKTINFPNDAKVEDVKEAYWLAYKLGCKGITIYRSGSKQLQVLNVGTKKEAKKENIQEENVSPELVNPEPNIAEIIPGSCPTCNI